MGHRNLRPITHEAHEDYEETGTNNFMSFMHFMVKKSLYNNSSAIFRRNICTYYFFENLELFLERPIKYLFLRKKNYTRELHLPPIIPGISPKVQGLPA